MVKAIGRRLVVVAALLLAIGSALPEAWAGDREDCGNPKTLVKTEPARVVAACRHLADEGVVWAQYNLGHIFYHGNGVPQSYVEAAKWVRKAADQGVAQAQHSLGILYAYGLGVPPTTLRQ